VRRIDDAVVKTTLLDPTTPSQALERVPPSFFAELLFSTQQQQQPHWSESAWQQQQQQHWSEGEWRIDPCTLAVIRTSVRSDHALAPPVPAFQMTTGGASGDEDEDDELSKREALRWARDERAAAKKLDAQVRKKGVQCCDAVGCSEHTAKSRRICAVHQRATEIVLEGEELPQRWCMRWWGCTS
jgi:hypothetical protein